MPEIDNAVDAATSGTNSSLIVASNLGSDPEALGTFSSQSRWNILLRDITAVDTIAIWDIAQLNITFALLVWLVFAEVSNIDFLDPISIGNLVFHLDTATQYCVYNLLTLEDKLEGYRRKPSKPVSFVKFDKVYLEVQEDYFISIMLPAASNDKLDHCPLLRQLGRSSMRNFSYEGLTSEVEITRLLKPI
jgi:hypothetical protein